MRPNSLYLFLTLIILLSGCSTETTVFNSLEDSEQVLRSITVEKVDIPESGYIMMFDQYGRPSNYTSIDHMDLFRSFTYNSDGQLATINYEIPSSASYQFQYEAGRLGEQDGFTNGDTVNMRFLYNSNEVQTLRFINDQYHSTSFFIFSDESLQTLQEVRSYDGGGQLRHQYQFEYDPRGNIIEEEHFVYDPFNDMMRFDHRVQQQFDDGRNPLTNSQQFDWMEAWYLSFFEQDTFIENISRRAPNNVLNQNIVSYIGQSTTHAFSYEYNAFNYPVKATRITNGEFGILKFSFAYYVD
ncbi:MAG: hypothetical protein HKN00_07250 [Flavobacteriaceae bacterium]|nr:hypothetical protein [Flavobacteriaceae bacterium]NNK71937.1 hypothetical protein [Flavobacteriaceae bacterium]